MHMPAIGAARASLGIGYISLFAILIGVSVVAAESYRQGGSSAIIEQQGAGRSEARVQRHADGQSIITEDGASTDITVQRQTPGSLDSDVDRHFRWYFDERFSGIDRRWWGEPDRQDFKHRMQQRLRNWPR